MEIFFTASLTQALIKCVIMNYSSQQSCPVPPVSALLIPYSLLIPWNVLILEQHNHFSSQPIWKKPIFNSLTLVGMLQWSWSQVITWCSQARSHLLGECLSRSMSSVSFTGHIVLRKWFDRRCIQSAFRLVMAWTFSLSALLVEMLTDTWLC